MLPAMDAEAAFKAARRAIGSESALNRVSNIHFDGYVMAEDSGRRARLKVIFKKPHLSWMQISSENFVEEIVANRFEGFFRRTDRETGEAKTQVIPARAVSRMHNLAWLHLHFYSSPGKRLGKAVSKGFAEMHGRLCHKVRIQFPANLWSDLYFEKESGVHFAMQDDNGLLRVLSGRIETSGIRFPEKITVFEEGRETRHMVFEKITVNQPVNARIFEFPTDS